MARFPDRRRAFGRAACLSPSWVRGRGHRGAICVRRPFGEQSTPGARLPLREGSGCQAMSDSPWPTTAPGSREPTGRTRASFHDELAPGTRLDEFEILSVLGIGAFGIVYLAYDHVLVRRVAIKVYMPA